MLLALLAFGCLDKTSEEDETTYDGLAVLGYSGNDTENVYFSTIGDADSASLNAPRDLAFNPENPGELWVVNRTDDSTSIFFDAGTEDQTVEHIIDPFAMHFMEEVSSIAFGKPGHFGTCQESRNTYNGSSMPNNFMGPTLWPSDLEIYGKSNEEAVRYLSELFGFHADLGSHLDMLHESPLCMGIAWEKDNVYWVFDGWNGDIVRYDFGEDHGPGYDDHSDGIIARYAIGEVEYVNNVPSHMELDRDTGLLYIADTGNNAIKVLDITIGTEGRSLATAEEGTSHYEMDNTDIQVLIDGAEHGMEYPSGLALVDNTLFITDYGTGIIHAFDLDGEPIDQYDTQAGQYSISGIIAPSIDDLWLVGVNHNKVWRIQPSGQ